MDKIFRLAVADDCEAVTAVYKKAIEHMNSQNIFQWDEIYPNIEVIQTDIEKRQMHVLLHGDIIVSVVVMNEQQDKEYQAGNWKYKDGKTAVIHRLCVNPDFQNKGIGRETVILAESALLKEGYTEIRLDAFSQNPYSLRLYNNLGYEKVGEVFFRKGKFYLFEKLLQV